MKKILMLALLTASHITLAVDTPAHQPIMKYHAGKHGDGAYHHRFQNAEQWAKKFDEPTRDQWQKPEQVINALHLNNNTLVADIGAGTGYFSTKIAKQLTNGKVYAVDIEPDMVRYLNERAQKEQLNNHIAVQASTDSPNLPEPVDIILLVDTYHHIGNRVSYFKQLANSLKTDGRLVLVDFTMESPEGPPKPHRISIEQATEELNAAGYQRVEKQDLPRQYLAIFKKSTTQQ